MVKIIFADGITNCALKVIQARNDESVIGYGML